MSAPSSSTDSETHHLDLAARTIDLITTVANASSKSNLVLSGILEIGEWLGREKLSRFALQDCLEKAKCLAITNSIGEALFPAILKRGDDLPVGHLFLRRSGSLGLLIARDPNLHWMVSTVACLFRFTNQESFVSEAICDYILGLRTANQGSFRPVIILRQDPIRIQLKSVLDKIVSSIWLNIVNSGGCYNVNLPGELKDVCSRGHNLDSHQFADVAICLKSPRGHIVIRSQHLLQNLTLWLHHHFHGRLQVTVGGKILYNKVLGPEEREIDLRVEMSCSKGGSCKKPNSKVEVLVSVSGRLETLISSQYPDRDDGSEINGSGVRQQFYIFAKDQGSEEGFGTSQFRLSTQETAWSMINWILSQRVMGPAHGPRDVSFQVLLDSTKTSKRRGTTCLTVGDLLYRVPGIINYGWHPSIDGEKVRSEKDELIIWKRSRTKLSHERRFKSSRGPQTGGNRVKNDREYDPVLERIIRNFPILQDLLRRFKRFCFCTLCSGSVNSHSSPKSVKTVTDELLYEFRDGCLKTEALRVVFILIAHSIADAMGCKDASGYKSSDAIFDGVSCLLDEIAGEDPRMTWKTWFHLTATVSLGCTFRLPESFKYDKGSTTVSVQYGASALVASWLDISKALRLQRCFAVAELRGGKIGVKSTSEDGSPQFVGVHEDFAIIQAEPTQDLITYDDAIVEKDPIPIDDLATIPVHDSTAESTMFLLSVTDGLYKVLLRVQTGQHSRFINPADATIGYGFYLEPENCQHGQGSGPSASRRLPNSAPLYLYSFDELLGQWLGRARRGGGSPEQEDSDSPAESPEGGRILPSRPKALHITQPLDTALKINVARAQAISSHPLICSLPFCTDCCSAAEATHVINEGLAADISEGYQVAIRQ
ncbi:uncharacterized protein PG998_013228 [Apiospora kogelbergensis]|uniref:uncharacterized protein n=1 Tax=Apiospora kogelbergensis TaxID=1337665 RepID=UPI00312F5C3F